VEPSTKWWTRRPTTRASVLIAIAVVLALVGATLGVTALIRLPARGTTCNATTATAEVFPSLVAVGDPAAKSRTTGTVVRGNGVILTSTIGVPASGGTVPVTLSDGETESASVVGTDAASGLAVVRVERRQLPFVLPSPREPATVGLPVVALGSPNANGSAVLSGTVQGIAPVEISAQPSWRLDGALTTDLPAPDANAGAPVVTCDDRLIGVVVGRAADGTAVAVSAATAHRVLTRLLGEG
jgi:S1-C subfamily serine protease